MIPAAGSWPACRTLPIRRGNAQRQSAAVLQSGRESWCGHDRSARLKRKKQTAVCFFRFRNRAGLYRTLLLRGRFFALGFFLSGHGGSPVRLVGKCNTRVAKQVYSICQGGGQAVFVSKCNPPAFSMGSGLFCRPAHLGLSDQRFPQGMTGTVEMLLAGAPSISLRLIAR